MTHSKVHLFQSMHFFFLSFFFKDFWFFFYFFLNSFFLFFLSLFFFFFVYFFLRFFSSFFFQALGEHCSQVVLKVPGEDATPKTWLLKYQTTKKTITEHRARHVLPASAPAVCVVLLCGDPPPRYIEQKVSK